MDKYVVIIDLEHDIYVPFHEFYVQIFKIITIITPKRY